MKSREVLKGEFYEGKLFKEELKHTLLPMLEEYDVVFVEVKNGLGSWH